MGDRGPKSEIDIDRVNLLKKKGWSNAKIGREFGVSGQCIGRRLKTEPVIEPVFKVSEPVSKKTEPVSQRIANLKKELRAEFEKENMLLRHFLVEFEKENVILRRALIKVKILKPVIPSCPQCGDRMDDYEGGGWHGRTYRAKCKKCGKYQRVHS